jgi:hypothetical protein
MRTFRILLGLLLIAVGGLAATMLGYQMLLAAAYSLWGLAVACCMGTAPACAVGAVGGYMAVGRMPGFMVYTPPVPRARVAAVTPSDGSPSA